MVKTLVHRIKITFYISLDDQITEISFQNIKYLQSINIVPCICKTFLNRRVVAIQPPVYWYFQNMNLTMTYVIGPRGGINYSGYIKLTLGKGSY